MGGLVLGVECPSLNVPDWSANDGIFSLFHNFKHWSILTVNQLSDQPPLKLLFHSFVGIFFEWRQKVKTSPAANQSRYQAFHRGS